MSGIATVSEGEALHWYGEGKTELTTASNLEVTYGVKSEVTVGFKTDVTIAGQTEIFIGSKFDASLALELSLKKNGEVGSGEEGEFYYTDNYVGTVGASATQLAAAKTLRTAAFILIAAQGLAMAAATVGATVVKARATGSGSKSESESGSDKDSKPDAESNTEKNVATGNDKDSDHDKKEGEDHDSKSESGHKSESGSEEEEIKVPLLNINLGYLTSILTIASSLGPALLLIYSKVKKLGQNNNPAGVLSMDAIGGVFLGTRAMAPTNASSGLMLNSVKAQLSAGQSDLEYERPAEGPSILGFKKNAGDSGVTGSRLEVCNDGTTRVYGQAFQADLLGTGTSKVILNAQEHHLSVSKPNSKRAAGPGLHLTSTATQMNFDNNNSLSVKSNTVTALAGGATGSAMRLTSSEASLGAAGNNLTVNSSGVILTYGQSKVMINATGISLGDAVTIMNPGAPGVSFSGLQNAVADVTTLKATVEATTALAEATDAKYDALNTLVNTTNRTLVSTRNRLKTVAAAAFSPKR